jgi:hypothetical protein
MPTLNDVLNDETKKKAILDDCVQLVDAEVADKSGLSGIAIKAGYGVVKGVKPGFVRHALAELLPEFAKAIDPFCAEARGKGRPVGDYLREQSTRVADALLAITDAKAARAKSGAVRGAYERLRGSAKKNVEQAVPRLSRMVEKYVG